MPRRTHDAIAKPAEHMLSGGSGWYHSREPKVTLADFRAAVDAYRDGNQTAFGREVMKCADGRQVRYWYAGSRMSSSYASRFVEWVKSKEGKATLLGQRELTPARKVGRRGSRAS